MTRAVWSWVVVSLLVLGMCVESVFGWVQIADVKPQTSGSCPAGWTFVSDVGGLCTRGEISGCASVEFSVPEAVKPWTSIKGRLLGVHFASMDGFQPAGDINGVYMDGISITRIDDSSGERQHVWSYAVGAKKEPIGSYQDRMCPCSTSATAHQPPAFVDDYYCEAGAGANGDTSVWPASWEEGVVDLLWDGSGCPAGNSCCSPTNAPAEGLPWFRKDLPAGTNSNATVEVRICSDQIYTNEDVGLFELELFVRRCADANCTACPTDSGVCTQCVSGLYLDSNGTCTDACHEACATCSGGSSADHCLTCAEPTFGASGIGVTSSHVSCTRGLSVKLHEHEGSCAPGMVPVASLNAVSAGAASPRLSLTKVASDPPGLPLPFRLSPTGIVLAKTADEGQFLFNLTVATLESGKQERKQVPMVAHVECPTAHGRGTNLSMALSMRLRGVSPVDVIADEAADASVSRTVERGLGSRKGSVSLLDTIESDGARGSVVLLSAVLPADALTRSDNLTISLTLDAAAAGGTQRGRQYLYAHAARVVSRAVGSCCTATVGFHCVHDENCLGGGSCDQTRHMCSCGCQSVTRAEAS